MKIKKEHYEHMKNEIENIFLNHLDRIDSHQKFILKDVNVKDPKKRLRWDLMYAAKLTKYVCDDLYSYLSDNHIDTALRSIIKEMNTKYGRDF